MATNDLQWPSFQSEAWTRTYPTLHMWSQVVGKIQLARAPRVNHWWASALHVTARGLTTSPIDDPRGTFVIAFDFIDHRLQIDTCDGRSRAIPLVPQSVADFYQLTMRALSELQIDVRIWPMPVEVPSPIRFTEDRVHASYDPESANRWWRALLQVAAVFDEFRARFLGKSSSPLFWWGSFDLAVTRFSGRRAPARENADTITREAYSHEVTSAGFWPGGGPIAEPAFYAYAAPEPAGFKTATVLPQTAFYSGDLNEFLLKYEDVRRAASPRETLLQFLQSTYEAGATLGQWNRAELERPATAEARGLEAWGTGRGGSLDPPDR